MKLSYRWKLSLYFCAIFLLFTIGMVAFEQSRARKAKTEILEERLDAYAGITERYISTHPDLSNIDSLLSYLPEKVRMTIITAAGNVVYDNAIEDTYLWGDHSDRPEIISASEHTKGSDIRLSASNNQQYLYYARQFGDHYIRVALPYDIEVKHFLKPDNIFLYYSIALFLVTLIFINLIAGRFGKSIKQLRDFSIAADKGDFRDSKIDFPSDELGEIGEKIVKDYQSLRDSQRIKQEMTGNIAHELRTPVTSIRGYLETVLDTPLPADKEREFIGKAYNQVLVLSELIHDMGLLTKIEQASGSFNFEPVNLYALINRVTDDMEVPLLANGTAIRNTLNPNTIVNGNETLLYSVLRNLTENVISHAGRNSIITVSEADRKNNMLYVSFVDNGNGIGDIKHMERLFERFYRVSEGRTRDTGGSGLGLSIVKNAITLHGGTINVRNSSEGGLEFVFTLPLK